MDINDLNELLLLSDDKIKFKGFKSFDKANKKETQTVFFNPLRV